MKIDWKRKLTSRKLWVAIAGFAAGIVVLFKGSEEIADKISGAILSGAAVVGYIFGEGLTDAANKSNQNNDGSDSNNGGA